MTLVVTHPFVSPKPTGNDPTRVYGSHWNANHTIIGTADASQLNANVVQSVTNDTNIQGSISGQNLTFSWGGTLAAARLNANVVQTITNDTNVTGSITAQNLTLAWSGQLGLSRGGTNADLSATGGVHQVLKQSSSGAAVTVGQLAFSDISGSVAASQLPNPSASTLGGVESYAAVSHQWINSISTSGVPSSTQPAFTDISGSVPNSQLATMAAWSFKANNTSGSATPTDITIDGLTLKATPASTDEVIIWDVAGSALKKATVSGIGSSSGVSSIGGNTGAFTLSHGLTNSTNDLQLDVSLLRGHLSGCLLSTAGSSATFSVSAGVGVDSTNADFMKLSSSISKTTSAWAVGTGNGALDTGAIANSTWYHVYLIKRTDTGVVDILISTSASSPTMPTNYTLSRRIGSMKTDGSAHWTKFVHLGDTFLWDVPTAVAYTASTSASLQTMNTPLGVKVPPVFSFFSNGVGESYYFSSPDTSDQAPSNSIGTLRAGASYQDSLAPAIWTNTSSQIRVRADGTAGTACSINTQGWIDTRGKWD